MREREEDRNEPSSEEQSREHVLHLSAEQLEPLMVIIYLYHDSDPDVAPARPKDVRALSTVINGVAKDSIDRFWVLATVLDSLWLGQNWLLLSDTCMGLMFKRRDTPASLRQVAQSDAGQTAKIKSLTERYYLEIMQTCA